VARAGGDAEPGVQRQAHDVEVHERHLRQRVRDLLGRQPAHDADALLNAQVLLVRQQQLVVRALQQARRPLVQQHAGRLRRHEHVDLVLRQHAARVQVRPLALVHRPRHE
jgi:hypothetical protein